MKSYYEVLGIEKDADAQQIKRAYFKQVREFPPERFPEEFKQIREAYEILTDDKKRAAYDRRGNIPQHVLPLFEHAQSLFRVGKFKEATDTLTTISKIYPECCEIKVELARIYEYQEKNGKAAEIWEQLCEMEPENSEYALELAQSYYWRGWHKKAIPHFRHAIELDSGNVRAWDGLIACYSEAGYREKLVSACYEGITALREHNTGSVRLNVYAFSYEISKGDIESAKCRLCDIAELARTDKKHHRTEIESAADKLLDMAMDFKYYNMLPYIREIIDSIPDVDENLRKSFESAEEYVEIECLNEKGFSVLFHDMLGTLSKGIESEDDANDLLAMECNILADLDGYRPQLARLKKEYPHLYNLHTVFFNEVMLTRNPDKLVYPRLKKLSKLGFQPNILPASGHAPDWDDDDKTIETVRRDGPKIGRNDPCPCGSGKKYKKCCGR